MTEYDAVVYDLDGTLVDLAVDWNVVAADVRAVYADANVDPPGTDLWAMLEGASECGIAGDVESAIAAHEREGAETAPKLAHTAELLEQSVPVGVCSLNCETACRIALERFDLAGAVDAVVGRDTVPERKPAPEPLLETVDRLEAAPSETLFIGDSERDERTARRAGTDFEYVGDRSSDV